LLDLNVKHDENPVAWLYAGAEAVLTAAMFLALLHRYVWAAAIAGAAIALCVIFWMPATRAHARKKLYVCTKCAARFSFDDVQGERHAT
jgi:hypothetical protein